ncbi:TPA: hypothetical protein ACM46C_004650, partial [Escherichia coli]
DDKFITTDYLQQCPTKWVQYRKLTYYGAIFFLPHNTATNHLHVMRQKASSAGHIIAHIPAR